MYALVFGPEWQDIMYFSSFEKGYLKLEKCLKNDDKSFDIFLIKYEDESDDGSLKERDVWKRSNKDDNAIIHTTAKQLWS